MRALAAALAAGLCLCAQGAAAGPTCSARARSAAVSDGCARLADLGRGSCLAKVDCGAARTVAPEALAAHLACAAGHPLDAAALERMIAGAGGEVAFRCCLATAMSHRRG